MPPPLVFKVRDAPDGFRNKNPFGMNRGPDPPDRLDWSACTIVITPSVARPRRPAVMAVRGLYLIARSPFSAGLPAFAAHSRIPVYECAVRVIPPRPDVQ